MWGEESGGDIEYRIIIISNIYSNSNNHSTSIPRQIKFCLSLVCVRWVSSSIPPPPYLPSSPPHPLSIAASSSSSSLSIAPLSVMLIVVFDVCHHSSAAISGVIGAIVPLLPFRTLRMQTGDFIVIGQRVAGQVARYFAVVTRGRHVSTALIIGSNIRLHSLTDRT